MARRRLEMSLTRPVPAGSTYTQNRTTHSGRDSSTPRSVAENALPLRPTSIHTSISTHSPDDAASNKSVNVNYSFVDPFVFFSVM